MRGVVSLLCSLSSAVGLMALFCGWQPEADTVAFTAFTGSGVAWLCLSKLERGDPR